MSFHTRNPGISGMPHSATLILLVNPQYIAEKGLFMSTEWESHGGWGKALNRNGVGKWRRKEGRSEIKIKKKWCRTMLYRNLLLCKPGVRRVRACMDE